MIDRGPGISHGEAPAGGFPMARGKRSGNRTRSRAFLGDTTGGLAYGF